MDRELDGGGERGESTSTGMDLRVLASLLGRERSLDRLAELALDAGLAIGTVTPVPARRVVELLPERG